MKNKKEFRVSKHLRRNIGMILARREIPYRFVRHKGEWYCRTVISGERFHKIVQRALCEKKTKEDGIVYLTYRESQIPELTEALLDQFNAKSFVILTKKEETKKEG